MMSARAIALLEQCITKHQRKSRSACMQACTSRPVGRAMRGKPQLAAVKCMFIGGRVAWRTPPHKHEADRASCARSEMHLTKGRGSRRCGASGRRRPGLKRPTGRTSARGVAGVMRRLSQRFFGTVPSGWESLLGNCRLALRPRARATHATSDRASAARPQSAERRTERTH